MRRLQDLCSAVHSGNRAASVPNRYLLICIANIDILKAASLLSPNGAKTEHLLRCSQIPL